MAIRFIFFVMDVCIGPVVENVSTLCHLDIGNTTPPREFYWMAIIAVVGEKIDLTHIKNFDVRFRNN